MELSLETTGPLTKTDLEFNGRRKEVQHTLQEDVIFTDGTAVADVHKQPKRS